MKSGRVIRVLIADDSAFVRRGLTDMLKNEKDMAVVGTAPDAYVTRDRIVELEPDVLILDVEMPRMDGITFLKRLMQYHPMPVIILSSVTPAGSRRALEALEAGAVEVLCKPEGQQPLSRIAALLVEKIRMAVSATIRGPRDRGPIERLTLGRTPDQIVAIGASTGGTEAVEEVLVRFPANAPGTLVVQHMPPHFTAMFAERLNKLCAMEVREAKNNDAVVPGLALIAPGGFHLLLHKRNGHWAVEVKDGPLVCSQRPSVDVLFMSVARAAGAKAVGVILTGMGHDGADGLLEMRNAGAFTIGQDEATSVIYGMPKEAEARKAVCVQLPLEDIAGGIVAHLSGRRIGSPSGSARKPDESEQGKEDTHHGG